jgi:hypothetical protein
MIGLQSGAPQFVAADSSVAVGLAGRRSVQGERGMDELPSVRLRDRATARDVGFGFGLL